MSSLKIPGPVRVAVVDIAEPIQDLDCSRSASPPYAGAWILVCRSGSPVGAVDIPLHGSRITARELEKVLRHSLGDAWWRPPRDHTRPPPPASVVVPTNLARPAQLRRCLQRLAALDYPEYEVIVVDNRTGDGPPAELPGAHVVREPRPGISAARNRGISVATGEILAFTDDDDEVDRSWLRAIADRFAREPRVAAVTGLVVPHELETPAQVLFEQSGVGPNRRYVPVTFERASPFRVRRYGTGGNGLQPYYGSGDLLSGCNMAFRTDLLRALGGFDEALGVGTPACSGEDLAMHIRILAAGYQVAYEPDAIVHHSYRVSLAELKRQLHNYGVGCTAMLTALTMRDPRTLAGIAGALPDWIRSRLGYSRAGCDRSAAKTYPRSLIRINRQGMLAGPAAYLRSRHLQRQWSKLAPPDAPYPYGAYLQHPTARSRRSRQTVAGQVGNEVHGLPGNVAVGSHDHTAVNEPHQPGGAPQHAEGVPADGEVTRGQMTADPRGPNGMEEHATGVRGLRPVLKYVYLGQRFLACRSQPECGP